MKLRRLAVPAVAAAALVLAAPAADAASGTTVQSAWWNEAAVGPLAVPSTTPADQLQVSYGGSGYETSKGPLAFAAVRIGLPTATPATDTVTLELSLPSGSAVGTPAVSACPTTSSWKPGADQPAASAPGYSCAGGREAAGSVNGSDETWSVPAAWATKGSLALALVPTAGTTAPFSVTYDQPTPASVTIAAPASASGVVAPPSSSSPPGQSTVVPVSPSPGTAVAPSPAPASAAPFAGSGSLTTGPAAPAASASPVLGGLSAGATAPTPPSSSRPASSAQGAPLAAAPGGGTVPASTPSRIPHLVAIILLLGVGVALFGLAGQPDRAPRLLGPLGDRLPGTGRRSTSAPLGRGAPSAALGAGGRASGGRASGGRAPSGLVAGGRAAGGLAAGGLVGRGLAEGAPASAALVSSPRAPMGGGARLRAHRQARLARTSGFSLAPDAVAAAFGAGTDPYLFGPDRPLPPPVRGIGRFARPRYGPPRRI